MFSFYNYFAEDDFVNFCNFLEFGKFKDKVEFGVFCNNNGENFLNDISRVYCSIFLYVWDRRDDFFQEFHDLIYHYNSLFNEYFDEYDSKNNIELYKDRQSKPIPGFREKFRVYNPGNIFEYLFKLYGNNNKYDRPIEGDFCLSRWNNTGIAEELGIQLFVTFLKEWDDLKASLNVQIEERKGRCVALGVNSSLKDSIYDLKSERDPILCNKYSRFGSYKEQGEEFAFLNNYNYYEHNGLFIKREFVDDNSLIDRDELMDWCEYVLNKTFRDLGVKYNKDIVQRYEQVEEQEIEMGR